MGDIAYNCYAALCFDCAFRRLSHGLQLLRTFKCDELSARQYEVITVDSTHTARFCLEGRSALRLFSLYMICTEVLVFGDNRMLAQKTHL